jgi:hypothetical protein
VESPVLSNGHAGFGGRAWEPDPEQSGHRAQARPNNLVQTVERCVSGHTACIRAATTVEASTIPQAPPPETEQAQPISPWPTGHRFADRARATHAAVHELLVAGHSQRAIARQLGMGGKTVARYARAATPEMLFTGQWQSRPSKLDDFKPYLHQRWTSGFTNVWALWKKITAQGYTGGYGAVSAYIRPMRTTPRSIAVRPPSARRVAGRIATHPDNLAEQHRLALKSVLAQCPELDALTRHVRSFADMLTRLKAERLPQWLNDVRADNLPRLHNFAAGLQRDLAAVTASLTLQWNSSVVEGHVNRIILWNLICQVHPCLLWFNRERSGARSSWPERRSDGARPGQGGDIGEPEQSANRSPDPAR